MSAPKPNTSFPSVPPSPASNIRTTSSFSSNYNSSGSGGSSLLASLESSHNASADDDNGFDPLKSLTQKNQQSVAKPMNALDISNDAASNIFMHDSGSSGSDGIDISTFMKFDDPNNPLLQAAKEPLAFDYSDSDSLLKELGDLYSYTELGDFARNRLAFQQVFRVRAGESASAVSWMELTRSEKDALVKSLLRSAVAGDNSPRASADRMQCLRAVLYLAQGSFSTDLVKVKNFIIEKRIRRNVCCLYRNGIWPILLAVLQREAEKTPLSSAATGLVPSAEAEEAAVDQKQQIPAMASTFCLKDSISLRIIMNLMYIIVEVLRRPVLAIEEPATIATATGASNNNTFNVTADAGSTSLSSSGVALPTFDVPVLAAAIGTPGVAVEDGESDSDDDIDAEADEEELNTFREQLIDDLRTKCMPRSDGNSRETLIVYLVKMLRQYIDGNHPHFAVKKILLLLWKCLLISLGGFSDLRRIKEEKRMEKGLPPGLEDTLEVAKRMCSSSPPMTGVEMLAAEIGRRSTIPSGNLLSLSGGGLMLNSSNNNDGRKVQPQRRLTGITDVFSQNSQNGSSPKTADPSNSAAGGGPAAKRRAMLRRTAEAPRARSADEDSDTVDNNNRSAAPDAGNDADRKTKNDDGVAGRQPDADVTKKPDAVNNYSEIGTSADGRLHAKSPEKITISGEKTSPSDNFFGDVSSAAVTNDADIIDDEEARRLLAQQQLVKNKRKRSFEEEVANEFNEKMPPSAEDEEIDEDDVSVEQEDEDNDTTLPEPSNADVIADAAGDEAGQPKKARRSSSELVNSESLNISADTVTKSPMKTNESGAGAEHCFSEDAEDDSSSQISSLASSVFSIRELADEKKLIERPLREVSHLKRLRFTPKVRQQDVYRWLSRVRTKLSQHHQQQQQPPSPASSATQSGVNGAAQASANGGITQNSSTAGVVGMSVIPRPIQFFSPPFPPYSRMAQHININFAQWNDHLTAGLPHPALSSYGVLQRYLYYSLSEVYLQEEQDMTAYSYAVGMQLYPRSSSFTEQLYMELLEEMPIFIVSLIRCIIAAGPSHKQQQAGGGGANQKQPQINAAQPGEQINVVNDMMPPDISLEIVEKLGIDVSRHKEIIMKACTFVLLLLMKHLKVNNTFQFEYMSILMVQGNGIALMMRFLNQNLLEYIEQINCVPQLEYPACVFGPSRSRKMNNLVDLGEYYDPIAVALREYPVEPMPTAENFMQADAGNFLQTSFASAEPARGSTAQNSSAGGNQSVLDLPAARRFSPRNLYTTINMLRIMQKLTKWKYARTLCLLHFKSQAKLKPLLRIRCPLLQVYVLKLLKCQVRYLGRQWRKSNMKIISAIYSKVRHRLSDEWAFGHIPMSEPELKLAIEDPKDEHALRAMVEGFNKRHYPNIKPRMPATVASNSSVQQQNSEPNSKKSELAAGVNPHVDLGANVWDMPPPWEISDKLASTCHRILSGTPSSSASFDLIGDAAADEREQDDGEVMLTNDDDVLMFGNNVAQNYDGSDRGLADNANGDDAGLAERFQSSLDMWVEEEVMNKSYNWDELVV